MNRSEIIECLQKMGASPRKALSQNFLIDRNILSKFIKLADIRRGDFVVEIGPGLGAITRELLNAGAYVTAIEKDRLFSAYLLQMPNQRLAIHCADFLDTPLPSTPCKIVSNLPYHITAPILEKLCTNALPSSSFTLIVQKELGSRMYAKPRTKEYGSFTIFLQFYTTYVSSFPISAHCFYPKPNVSSMAICLHARPPPAIDPNLFFPIVRKAFQQRRKMIASSLKTLYPDVESALQSAGLSKTARPEELSLEEWIAFALVLPRETIFLTPRKWSS